RQLEIVDRAQQHRIDLRSTTYRRFVGVASAFQGGKHRDLIHQDASRLTNGFLRRDHAVGFDIQHQLVEVGALLNTSALDGVADAAYGAERSVQHDTTDGVRTVFGQRA